MRWLAVLFLFGFGGPLDAAPAWAETRQFANMIYELPAGWKPNGKTAGRQELRYAADDGRCDGCRILLDRGAEGGGPIDAWRDGLAVPGEDQSVVGDPKIQRDTIGGRPVAVLMRQIEDDGRSKFQAFFAIDLPGRNELVVFESSARDKETFEQSLATMNADLVTMLTTMTFVSEGAEPLLGPPESGDLEGPWFGTAIRNRYNGLSGTLELVVDQRLMTFYPDGRFYSGIPPSGSGPLDVEGLVSAGETRLGNYVVSGDEIELRFVDGDVKHMSLLGDDVISAGGVRIHRAEFPPDGFRFAGTIHSVRYTAFGAGVSGGVGSESTQIFREDGTFSDSSFTGAFGSFDTGGGFTTMAERPERLGHYEVADGLITLAPPDGSPRTTTIILDGRSNVIVGGQPVSEPGDQ